MRTNQKRKNYFYITSLSTTHLTSHHNVRTKRNCAKVVKIETSCEKKSKSWLRIYSVVLFDGFEFSCNALERRMPEWLNPSSVRTQSKETTYIRHLSQSRREKQKRKNSSHQFSSGRPFFVWIVSVLSFEHNHRSKPLSSKVRNGVFSFLLSSWINLRPFLLLLLWICLSFSAPCFFFFFGFDVLFVLVCANFSLLSHANFCFNFYYWQFSFQSPWRSYLNTEWSKQHLFFSLTAQISQLEAELIIYLHLQESHSILKLKWLVDLVLIFGTAPNPCDVEMVALQHLERHC